jgi:hypothetical protein
MTLQSSGPISLLDIQNEFKGTDESIESLTGVSKLQPSVWTDNTTPFPGRNATTGTATGDTPISISPLTIINPKTSYGSITYSNTSNDNQLSEYSIPINEYYRNGIYVPDRDSSDTLVNQNVPTSGEISFANFYGGVNEDIILRINSNRVNLNLETAFNTESGSGSWTDRRRKRLIINLDIVIGGTSANADKCALRIPENLIGGLIIINYGDIVGYGGLEGQNGGNAILVGADAPTVTNTISSISHNLKFGIYGVVPQLTGLNNRYLTPIGPDTASKGIANIDRDYSIAHGTEEFSVGDSIYIYNNPTDLGFTGDLIPDSSSSTEALVNLCKISEKQTATFTAYISNGNLGDPGNILSVISGTQPSIGMGIIKGTNYKKHIIVRTNTASSTNVTFNGTKLLRADAGTFNLGMVISGTGVEFGTIVKGRKSFFPPSTSYWGTISGTTFTVTVTPTELISPGYYLNGSLFANETVYIVEQLTGTPGKVGTYRVNVDASGSNIDSYGYLELNKSQNITGPVSVTGIRHVLNDDTFDGISTENEINTNFGNGRSMTAVRYILDRIVSTSLNLQNKSSNFKFFTAGGTTSPGFTVTTTQVDPITGSTALSALTEGQSVTISGSTAAATGTNTTAINASIFNGTWNNIDKLNATQFFVATTKIDNTYSTITGGGGTFPTSPISPFTTVPIKILNYGGIYGGGGGGSNSVATKNPGELRNYLANQYDSSSTGSLSSSTPINGITDNELAFKIQLDIDGGLNGVGGVGQGYNQAKTLGTTGTPNPNAKKYVYFIGYGNANNWGVKVNPYLDLISIPPNTEVSLGLIGWMKDLLNNAQATWKNVYLGSESSFLTKSWNPPAASNYSGTIHSGSGFGPANSHLIKITNLYAFGTDNRISFQPSLANGAPYRQIINFYRLTQSVAPTISTGWTINNTSTVPQTNPYPTDRVRIVTTTNQYTYEITFPEQILARKAGDGGNYGSPGISVSGYTVPNGQAGLFISNSFIYSNVTWVNRGDLKGRES